MSLNKCTLKSARVMAGLNQEDAASMIGISKETLSNYERGKSFPDVPTLKKIEDLYGVEYKDLIFLNLNYD